MKCVLFLLALVTLTACGGGGTSSVSFATLSVLGNGDGIARAKADDGSQVLIYTPEVVEVVASANSVTSSEIANLSASDFPITAQNQYILVRTGTFTSEGITFNVTGVEDKITNNASVLFIEMPSGMNDISMVGGTKYRNAPRGQYTYFGTQMSTYRNSIAPGSFGSFALVADFENRAFGYSGSSGSLEVNGGGVLDIANGRFATSNLTVTAGSSTYGGTMHGMLHGSGATATSGVFHTSGYSPLYTGAFVGGMDN